MSMRLRIVLRGIGGAGLRMANVCLGSIDEYSQGAGNRHWGTRTRTSPRQERSNRQQAGRKEATESGGIAFLHFPKSMIAASPVPLTIAGHGF